MLEIQPNQSAEMRRAIFAERMVEMFKAGGKDAAYDPEAREVVVKDAKANPTRLGFDNQGFIGSITSPLGRTWNLDNNPDGKLLGIRNPAGLHLGFDYNEEGDITRIARNDKPMLYLDYEYKGYPRSVTFPDDTRTEFRYNDQVKLEGLTTRRGVSEHYEYDTDGDITAITDGNGNRTQFDYGLWNRPDQARYPDGGTERYQYNPDGLLQRLISGTDTLAEIDYTEAGKPKEIRYSDGQVLRFEYNEQGKITKAQNAEITLNYSYDEQGRLLSEERDGQTAAYHYDEIGALAGITYPSGETVDFEYDADQRLIAIKDWQDGFHRFRYLDNDSGVEHSHPGVVKTTIRNSPLGQPLDITVTGAGYHKLFSFRYQYDNEDRVQSFNDSHLGTRAYRYDADNQLLGVSSTDTPPLREQFAYDKAGNRTECNGQQASFNNLNQVLKQGNNQCAYDSRGNLIEYRTRHETWHYTYDARNQLIRAKSSQGTDVSFGYDAFGRRLWKRSGEREVRFFWLGENLIGETVYENGEVVNTQDYLFVPGTFTPLATHINNEVYSYHTDHLGTPRRLTDKTGRVVWAADYLAFGDALISVREVENNLRFPGQYFDMETGLHYNRFRYYSPMFGRYLTKDPATYIGGLNFYAYAKNNPISFSDPFGLLAFLAIIGIGALVGGLIYAGIETYKQLNDDKQGFCITCVIGEFFKGAIVGGIGSIPFLFLSSNPGGWALLSAGVSSGGLGYLTDLELTPGAEFSWTNLAVSMGLGGVFSFAGHHLAKALGPRVSQLFNKFFGPKIPQGLTQSQFQKLSQKVLSKAKDLGLGDDIVVQGSRAKGTATSLSDIDIAIRVSPDKFDDFLNKFSRLKNPNPGSNLEKGRLYAIENGVIKSGEARLSSLRKELEKLLNMKVDISVVKQGGSFDTQPTIPIN
jgi:RHS repeat-associated protein